jgi:uncharacterized membrane protein YraQ (UPF0718 family)
MIYLADLLLWIVAAALAAGAARRGRAVLTASAREGVIDFCKLMPRILFGVVGSGYIAALLPEDLVGRWLGADSGATGVLIAVVAGAFTPGGPVVGFSVGAAALKGGAAMPQVIAYVTAWALFAVQRLVQWEYPVMPLRLVWLRTASSLLLPFLAALGAIVIGRP